MPSITVQTAQLSGSSNGKIAPNSSFTWLNTDTTQSILVSDVGSWCEDSSYSVPQAASASSPGSISANTLNVSGTFSYSSPGYDKPTRPSIQIGAK
jgi:hypothetical protein